MVEEKETHPPLPVLDSVLQKLSLIFITDLKRRKELTVQMLCTKNCASSFMYGNYINGNKILGSL